MSFHDIGTLAPGLAPVALEGSTQQDEKLTQAVASGDIGKVREFFDKAFWDNRKVQPGWVHVKMALEREDSPMLRLLATWGAEVSGQNIKSLQVESPDIGKYTQSISMMRNCGMWLPDGALHEANGIVNKTVDSFIGELRVPEKNAIRQEPEVYEIGQAVKGKGVYIGTWEPKDRDNNSLGKTFNIFAAPQNLEKHDTFLDKVCAIFADHRVTEWDDQLEYRYRNTLFTFNEAVQRVASLKNWHGHNGGDYKNDTAIYKSLKEGSYKGEWFIPTRELLVGINGDGHDVQPDNLYTHKDKGTLKGTFSNITQGIYPYYPAWYWSSTESRTNQDTVWNVRSSDSCELTTRKDVNRISCRPMRVEPRP